MYGGNTLVILSVTSNRALEWALHVISAKSPENIWVVVDERTMKILARKNLTRTLGERIIVYSGKKPEEFSLRVLVFAKPDELYVCDERGVLEPVIRLLRVLRISTYEC